MLDKRTKLLLNYIVANCETGSYNIISNADLIGSFPKRYKIDDVVIKQILTYLTERNYIEIKHSDEKCCCVSVLPKARIECEIDENSQKNAKKLKKIAIFAIIFAFLGAIVGGVIGAILVKFIF